MPRPVPPDLPPSAATAPPARRLPIVDAARGLAIVQMVAYHFCYDLNYFGWIHIDMTRDPAWIAWRTAIVTQFLFVAGVALALRDAVAPPATRLFTPRWWQIAGCAALVSAASAVLFGPRWIWFGVLHFIALAQVLVWPLRGRAIASALLGALLLALGLLVQLDAFAPNSLSWIGFSPSKPRTEDFVPVLPWIGVVLLGLAAGLQWPPRGLALARLAGSPAPVLAHLARVGRWPLTIYMLHQPLLMGALAALQAARRAIA